jgi:hypothetical protein
LVGRIERELRAYFMRHQHRQSEHNLPAN